MIVRLLIWLIIGFLVYTVVQSIKQLMQKAPPQRPEKTPEGEDMVQDPHCGTFVSQSDSISCQIGGKQHFFCSAGCRDRYKEQHSRQ